MAAFKALLKGLQSLPPESEFEPDVDERDEKEERGIREAEDLSNGAVLKGVLQEGKGQHVPKDGDVVLLHYTVRDTDQRALESTREEDGGSGQPRPFVMGKGTRMPRGWELALYDMREGERAALRIKPEYGYGHKLCGLAAPPGLADPSKAELLVDLQLAALWRKADGARAVGGAASSSGSGSMGGGKGGGECFKRQVVESENWENPREPYEVELSLQARAASSSGAIGQGQLYYSSDKQPMRFAIGDGSVPKGLEGCVCTMYKGERSIFLVPAAAATPPPGGGGSALPAPPPGVDWVEFDVTLMHIVQVRDLTGRGELLKRRLKDGVGQFPMDCPLEDSRVRLHYKVRAAGSDEVVHDTRGADGSNPPVEFDSGMGVMPDAVDICSRLMLPGEVAEVDSTWDHAFKGRDDAPEGLAPGGRVLFEIELVGFDKNAAWVEMEATKKVSQALALKDQGNQLFKEGDFKRAEQKYMRCLRVLNSATPEADTQEVLDDISRHKTSTMVNLGMVAHRTQAYGEAITWCTKAIREDAQQPKAYFRRALAHGVLGHWEEVVQDMAAVVELDESLRPEVERELQRMQAKEKTGDARQRKEMASFFDRKAGGGK